MKRKSTTGDQVLLDQINTALKLKKPVIPLLVDSSFRWPLENPAEELYLSEQLLYRKFFLEDSFKDAESTEVYWPDESLNQLTFDIRKIVADNRDRSSSWTRKKFDVFISYETEQRNLATELGENVGLKFFVF